MRTEKSTELQLQERVNTVCKLILEGFSNRKILFQHIAENLKWNVTERTLDNYLKLAREILSTISENELEYEKNIALNRLDALYSMSYKIHDFRECRNIIESRAKILGYNAPDKTDITTNGKDINITPTIIGINADKS